MTAQPEDVKLERDEVLRDYALQRALDYFYDIPKKSPDDVVRVAAVFEAYLRKGAPSGAVRLMRKTP